MMTRELVAPQSIPVVILTLETTTRAGSCAVWRGQGMVDEVVGNPEYTHAHRLPNDLAKLLASGERAAFHGPYQPTRDSPPGWAPSAASRVGTSGTVRSSQPTTPATVGSARAGPSSSGVSSATVIAWTITVLSKWFGASAG